MKKIFFVITSLIICSLANATNDTTRLAINAYPVDLDYQLKASEVYTPLGTLFTPSMQQSLDITASMYNLAFYTLDRIKWTKIKQPFLRPLAQTLTFYSAIIGLTFFPFGDSWLHEEFHRSILTYHGIHSHDQVYDFPIFSSLISVNDVSDSALIAFKASSPADFIRLHEAGIEGEYLLINRLNTLNFFYNQDYPYYIPELLIALNSFYYVWSCHTQVAQKITQELNQKEINIKDRDFTGLDFTAWVYDLFRPDEPYSARGTHPSGTGIDRYRKPSDLTAQELSYLKRQGYMQLINFISPFLLNINGFTYGQLKFNFAFRYFLTSFGSDLTIHNYLKTNRLNLIISTHFFHNYNKTFPGLELQVVDYSFFHKHLILNTDFQIFAQPKNFDFHTQEPMFGSSATINMGIKALPHTFIRLGITAKTKGWVAGIVQQTETLNGFLGLTYRF